MSLTVLINPIHFFNSNFTVEQLAADDASSQSTEDWGSRSPPAGANVSRNPASCLSTAPPGSQSSHQRPAAEGYTQHFTAPLLVDEQGGRDTEDIGEFDCFDQPYPFF